MAKASTDAEDIGMKLGRVLGLTVLFFVFLVLMFGCKSKPSYLKKASGSWQISVQIPDCEFGHVIAIPPEREGDVVTIYCNQMPVEGK